MDKKSKYSRLRLGEEAVNKYGDYMQIIAYRGSKDMDVMFEGDTIVTGVSYRQFKSGTLKNPNSVTKSDESDSDDDYETVFGVNSELIDSIFSPVKVLNEKDNTPTQQSKHKRTPVEIVGRPTKSETPNEKEQIEEKAESAPVEKAESAPVEAAEKSVKTPKTKTKSYKEKPTLPEYNKEQLIGLLDALLQSKVVNKVKEEHSEEISDTPDVPVEVKKDAVEMETVEVEPVHSPVKRAHSTSKVSQTIETKFTIGNDRNVKSVNVEIVNGELIVKVEVI
jgi:hypothetical protein